VIVAEPAATAEASPLEPWAFVMVATAVSVELQVTVAVISWRELSERMPMAVNCMVVPFAMLGFVGDTSIDTSVAEVAVSVVFPETVPDVAVIVAEPAATAVARPLEPAMLLTAATLVFDVLQVTDDVRS